MTGRIRLRDSRVYADGYDVSGYTRSFGPLICTFEEGIDDALTLNVKAVVPGNANVGMGTLNGLFDNTATSGLHVLMNGAGVKRNVMIPIGVQAPPVDGDPVFVGQFLQSGYQGDPGANPVTASIPFANSANPSDNLSYARPWGVLLLAKASKTAANSAVGIDQVASSAKGGFFTYQVFAGDGNAAIKVQDADTNVDGSFNDLLTSGNIDCSSPTSGVVALAKTATVEQFIRWQIDLDTATTVTLAVSWHRGL